MAPLQKAGIVALIKNRTDDMTLAIGDGKTLSLSLFFFSFLFFLPCEKKEQRIEKTHLLERNVMKTSLFYWILA